MISPRTVVVDSHIIDHGDISWDKLAEFGPLRIGKSPAASLVAAAEFIGDAQAALLQPDLVKKELLAECKSLRFVNLTSTGYDLLSQDTLRFAAENGITICNAPTYGANSVAQHAFALLLELCNHAGYYDGVVRDGIWQKSGDFCFWDKSLTELAGKTIGIIGFGAIGRKVAQIALGFDMKVLTTGSRRAPQASCGIEITAKEELLCRADIVSLHCPLTPQTRETINRQSICSMKTGAFLINTARGGLLQADDVAQALCSGKLGGVGLDVFSREPVAQNDILLRAPNCIMTPHLAWASVEARQRLVDQFAENLGSFVLGKPINAIT